MKPGEPASRSDTQTANGQEPLVTSEELGRLREIEHRAWHLMDDSEENGTTGEVVIRPMRHDYDRLAELLPEDHPPEWLSAFTATRSELGKPSAWLVKSDRLSLGMPWRYSFIDKESADQDARDEKIGGATVVEVVPLYERPEQTKETK